jgi:hypothetical protein
MNGFSATASMASAVSYSSFVPSRIGWKIDYFTDAYVGDLDRLKRRGPHSKFAPAHLLCDAQ